VLNQGFSFRQRSLSFEPNIGQSDGPVRFLARAPGAIFYFTNAGVASAQFRLDILAEILHPGSPGFSPVVGKSNYFIGNDPAKWRIGVSQFAE